VRKIASIAKQFLVNTICEKFYYSTLLKCENEINKTKPNAPWD
jgi:hypothetical protein